MKSKRKAIPKKTRFEVLKRDKFTCQYCGQKAPDVLLCIDHIEPVAKGGTNSILNLIAACEACNGGKGDRRLSEAGALQKARNELERLEEKRQQIEMMADWHKSLIDIKDREIDLIAEHFQAQAEGYGVSAHGRRMLAKMLKTFEFNEILVAIDDATASYFRDGITSEAVSKAFNKLGGVCRMNRVKEESPEIAQLYYCRGILRNRLSYVPWNAIDELRAAYDAGIPIAAIKEICSDASRWSEVVYQINLQLGS